MMPETSSNVGDGCLVDYEIRAATAADGEAMYALMPRLAEFEVPESREPEDLWRDDLTLLRECLSGKTDDCFAQLAENSDGAILGLTLVRMRPDLLSHEPSSHLEAIAVSKEAEGRGVARALLCACEEEASKRGALTMTLHVISTNSRARRFYERSGYDGEMIRYIKPIDS